MGYDMNFLTIGKKSTEEFGVWISGDGTFGSPERDVEEVSVDGRDGTLIIDNGRFSNIAVAYSAFIPNHFKGKMDGFRNYIGSLRGYQRLEDTYHPEYYRMACFSAGLEPKMTPLNRAGEFTIEFNCKPQRWLKSGERTISFGKSGVLNNPTLFDAKPKIRLYGKGTLTIGENSLKIDPLYPNDYIDIDCDLMNAYFGTLNFNNYVSGTFPVLVPGKNEITWTGTSLEITPNWWRL